MRLTERFITALSLNDMTIKQLTNALFVSRESARQAAGQLLAAGKIRRIAVHNRKSGRPEYRYSLVSPSTQAARADSVSRMVGDWYSI